MKGKIYKMVNSNGLMYIGSTTQRLKQRLCEHRCHYRLFLKGKHHWVTSFKLLEDDADVKIELVETVDDCDKKGLHDKERYWIEFYKGKCGDKIVNKYIPNRTSVQYRKDNREKELNRHKQYYKDNREKELKRYKQYYNDNRENELKRYKQYQKDNKERISAYRSQQQRCICGGLYTLYHKAQHMKTAKHKRFDNTLNYLKEVDPEFYDLILKDHGTTRNINIINNIHIHS